MDINHFDKIFYINLDHRTDRKKEILEEFNKLKISFHKVIRISAVYDKKNGAKGCVQSHIKALELAIKQNLKNVLIIEDDCEFSTTSLEIKNFLTSFSAYFQNSWDVLFFGADIKNFKKTKKEEFIQVLKARCSHSYAINNHYFKKLLNNFKKSFELIEKDEEFNPLSPTELDVVWYELQMKDKWYIGKKMLTNQKKSYSDIEHREIKRDYKNIN